MTVFSAHILLSDMNRPAAGDSPVFPDKKRHGPGKRYLFGLLKNFEIIRNNSFLQERYRGAKLSD
jgi:hypothetical protein